MGDLNTLKRLFPVESNPWVDECDNRASSINGPYSIPGTPNNEPWRAKTDDWGPFTIEKEGDPLLEGLEDAIRRIVKEELEKLREKNDDYVVHTAYLDKYQKRHL